MAPAASFHCLKSCRDYDFFSTLTPDFLRSFHQREGNCLSNRFFKTSIVFFSQIMESHVVQKIHHVQVVFQHWKLWTPFSGSFRNPKASVRSTVPDSGAKTEQILSQIPSQALSEMVLWADHSALIAFWSFIYLLTDRLPKFWSTIPSRLWSSRFHIHHR